MERAEAEQLRARLTAEHPDRTTHSFILSERDGDWTVAKVALPPVIETATGVAKPQPSHDHEPTALPGSLPNNSVPGF
jgi:hypothetical protein